MPRRLAASFVWFLVFVSAACSSGAYYSTAPKGLIARSAAPSNAAETASLDGVTNGMASNDAAGARFAADPAMNPLLGAFFNDGGNGDIRARAENLYEFQAGQQGQGSQQGEPGERVARLLIHSGTVAVEVPQPEVAIADLLRRVEDWGGYLQSRAGTTVTLRVPAQHFDVAFESLRDLGRVLSQARRANDVTEEYRDLEIRLGNARKSRERLLAILEEAEKVEDILKIEEQLRRLTDEIETMEGRRRLLADQVALSTLTAEFRAVSEPPPDRRRRRPSRFAWINLIGAERLMEDF
ncbi:MAG: DUF4349 domain-containing protein [bacterium]|nr:DUF4349 domain-containing protein [bacterium]